ncbi:hypothetical protein V6Z11_A07G200600 [Gossypium hirsutum]
MGFKVDCLSLYREDAAFSYEDPSLRKVLIHIRLLNR